MGLLSLSLYDKHCLLIKIESSIANWIGLNWAESEKNILNFPFFVGNRIWQQEITKSNSWLIYEVKYFKLAHKPALEVSWKISKPYFGFKDS